jgi:DNA-binding response OmpR family regulator
VLLVVEDEVGIQELLEIVLADAGFEVMTASDGDQAIAELNTGAARFKAVITDIRLGTGPDGWEVGRRARELVPNMAVVYVTADSGHLWPSRGVPGSVLVSKPFAMAQITTAVSTLLAEADARQAISGADSQEAGSHGR